MIFLREFFRIIQPVNLRGFIKLAALVALFVPVVAFGQEEDTQTEVITGQDGPPVVPGGPPVPISPEWTFSFSGGTVEQAATANGSHVAGTTETATMTSSGIKRFKATGNRAWFTGTVTVTVTHDDAGYGKVPDSVLFQRYMQHQIDGSGKIPSTTPIDPTGQTSYVFQIRGGANNGTTGTEYNVFGEHSSEYQWVNRAPDGTWTVTFATDWETPSNIWDTVAYQQQMATKWKMNLRVTAIVPKLSITASGYANCKNSFVDETGTMQVLAGTKLSGVVTTSSWNIPWQTTLNGDWGITPTIQQATNSTYDLPRNTLDSPLFAYKSFAAPGDPAGGNWDDPNYGANFTPVLQEFTSLTAISLANSTPVVFYLAGLGSDEIKGHTTFTTEANAIPFNPIVEVMVNYPQSLSVNYDPERMNATSGSYQYLAFGDQTNEHDIQIRYLRQKNEQKAPGLSFQTKIVIPASFFNGSTSPTCKVFFQQLIAGFATYQVYPQDVLHAIYYTDPVPQGLNFQNYGDGYFVYPSSGQDLKAHANLVCIGPSGDEQIPNYIWMADTPGLVNCNINDPGTSSAGSVVKFNQGSNLNAYVMLKVGDQLVPVMYARWGIDVLVKRKKYDDATNQIDTSAASFTKNNSLAPTSYQITGKVDFPVYSGIVPIQ